MATQTAYGTFQRGDLDHEVSVTFEARMVRDDYGVPRSPVWWTPEDIEPVDYEIDGEGYSYATACQTFGEAWINSVTNALGEDLDDRAWEAPEPEYWGPEPWELAAE